MEKLLRFETHPPFRASFLLEVEWVKAHFQLGIKKGKKVFKLRRWFI